jgi:hypothetical protein
MHLGTLEFKQDKFVILKMPAPSSSREGPFPGWCSQGTIINAGF